MSNEVSIPKDYIERVYAGWLGKVIGVRHGANIEQWTYDRIEKAFGEITHYPHQFKNLAADDDTNGPMFFLRALEDYTHTSDITPEQIGLTWLNYAPDGHSFYWWGGYGISSEHTAYMNLKNGIMAPRSGSIEQNGTTVAEQIGGQIFIDSWGLIAPGKPKLAAEYAAKAASVSHDGNGVYGGMFIAACIAAAFNEQSIEQIIEAGLSVIPEDCEYATMTRDVMRFQQEHPENWRGCFKYVYDKYGYHRYPGNCHIIPNSAVIVLSLLYSEGSFANAINICNMCGWDTDCNVANVGCIMGVRNGLDDIDMSWREPINDFLCCSSVIGSLNILDLPWCASYISNLGYKIAGEEPPTVWNDILQENASRFHFEYPGSTHAFRLESDDRSIQSRAVNTTEAAYSGSRSLKISFDHAKGGCGYRAYVKTYYTPDDFNDSRYDPSFSPTLYPGQAISCQVMVPQSKNKDIQARLYVTDRHTGDVYYGNKVRLSEDEWTHLEYYIPAMQGVCIERAGVELIAANDVRSDSLVAYIDDFDFLGLPDYAIDFSKEQEEHWNGLHIEVSQLTYLRGLWRLENGELSGSYSGESAEAYTGDLKWKDYSFEAEVVPKLGDTHRINFRVQGGIRSYAIGLETDGKLVLAKKSHKGYTEIASTSVDWQHEQVYTLGVKATGEHFEISVNGRVVMEAEDLDQPYLHGQVGFSNADGSHTHYKGFKVQGI